MSEPFVGGILLARLAQIEREVQTPAKTHPCTAKLPGCIVNIEDAVSTHHTCWRCCHWRRCCKEACCAGVGR